MTPNSVDLAGHFNLFFKVKNYWHLSSSSEKNSFETVLRLLAAGTLKTLVVQGVECSRQGLCYLGEHLSGGSSGPGDGQEQ